MYLYCNKLGTIGLQHPQRQGSVVREIGVIWSGTKEVKDDGDVKREHRDGQVPAIQHRRQTTVQEDTEDGEMK